MTKNEFHTHPKMQEQLKVDDKHVIVDRESFEKAYKLLFPADSSFLQQQ